jgi:hypothetical protein
VSLDLTTLHNLRRALLWTVAAGLAGTGAELLLLGHVEGSAQFIPLVLIAASLGVVCWHALRPSPASVQALRAAMGLCVLSGVLGVGLHYRGNLEFEREISPEAAGTELLGQVVTGATPVLAPGGMALLGVIGFLHAYRHPRRMSHPKIKSAEGGHAGEIQR